jgi:septum site-determining protein MinC
LEQFLAASKPVSSLIRLRGTTVPVIALNVPDPHAQQLEAELARKVAEAAGSLVGALAVIDLSGLACDSEMLASLAAMAQRFGMTAVAVLGADERGEQQARALGLATLPAEARGRRTGKAVSESREVVTPAPRSDPPAPETAERSSAAQAPVQTSDAMQTAATPGAAMVIERPLRSGQRIYARGRDLVVLAGASPGSELIADGNIHCYGALRGRALAGARGDQSANVFALDFQAELVSVAGVYKAFEELPAEVQGRPVRASLQQDGEQRRILLTPLPG